MVTNCNTLSVETAGGIQKMNFSTLEGIFRIIQSIPSKKAEPIKRWLAAVGAERINQMQDQKKALSRRSLIIGDSVILNNGSTRDIEDIYGD